MGPVLSTGSTSRMKQVIDNYKAWWCYNESTQELTDPDRFDNVPGLISQVAWDDVLTRGYLILNNKYYISFWSETRNSLIFSQCKDEDEMNTRYEALLLRGRTCVMKYKGLLPHER